MKIVIIAGGTPPNCGLLKRIVSESDYVIAADRGADVLFKSGISPDLLLGDFDSVDPVTLEHYKRNNFLMETYPSEKDSTDTEIALEKAFEMGASVVYLLGCTGTRIDHLLGNIGLLLKCLKNNVKAYLVDDYNEISITDKSSVLAGNKGEIFSVHAYCEIVEGLSIKGAKYEIQNYDLKLGDGITISNEFSAASVEINFRSGILLVIRSKD